MGTKSRGALLALTLALFNVLGAHAQLLPQVTPQKTKPPALKPAQSLDEDPAEALTRK